MFGKNESIKKVKHFSIKAKVTNNDIFVGEIIGEQKIVGKQGIMKTIYKFVDGKVVSCLNISEFYSDSFQKVMFDFYKNNNLDLKNIKWEDNVLTYEWSDEFFKQKGEGATPYEIKKFLKNQKYKVKIKYNK